MNDQEKTIKDFIKWVDGQVDFDKIVGGLGGKVLETVDGAIFRFAIEFGFAKIPTEYQDEALITMNAVIVGDYDAIASEAIEELVLAIKTPLGDEKEAIIIGGIWDIVSKLINAKKS